MKRREGDVQSRLRDWEPDQLVFIHEHELARLARLVDHSFDHSRVYKMIGQSQEPQVLPLLTCHSLSLSLSLVSFSL